MTPKTYLAAFWACTVIAGYFAVTRCWWTDIAMTAVFLAFTVAQAVALRRAR